MSQLPRKRGTGCRYFKSTNNAEMSLFVAIAMHYRHYRRRHGSVCVGCETTLVILTQYHRLSTARRRSFSRPGFLAELPQRKFSAEAEDSRRACASTEDCRSDVPGTSSHSPALSLCSPLRQATLFRWLNQTGILCGLLWCYHYLFPSQKIARRRL